MPTKADSKEIWDRGALIVRRHLRKIVDPSRLAPKKDEPKSGGYPVWHLCLDGDKGVCYIGVGKKGNLVSFEVHGTGTKYRKYDTFGEAERDDEFKAELVSRVKMLIGAGGGE